MSDDDVTAVERAAVVIGAYDRACALDPDNGEPATPMAMAWELADAGLLVTDADRAVLDAADQQELDHRQWTKLGRPEQIFCPEPICVAVRARRKAQR